MTDETVTLRIAPGDIQTALHAMARFGREKVAMRRDSRTIFVEGVPWQQILPAKEFFSTRGVRVEVAL
jgi:hypothetical protein